MTRSPKLGKLLARRWDPATRAWWAAVWASDVAEIYLDSDVHGLLRLAVLVDDFWGATDPKLRRELGAEIRVEQRAYGLSPADRPGVGVGGTVSTLMRSCDWCGLKFLARHPSARYCQPAHRAAASRSRRER